MGCRDAHLDQAQVLGKRIQWRGWTFRSRSDQFKAAFAELATNQVWGKLVLVIDESLVAIKVGGSLPPMAVFQ
ncbi:hypothetical protein PspS35_10510 [Pseudomonas sp. S35]|nr:hypothetical protein PspS35_10510 [Pseudomonas sp. S35]